MRKIFRHESESIGHFHGVWTEPESVILSDGDYAAMVGNAPAQFMQSAHYATRSFVFVGYGDGLKDPNFLQMLQLHRELFPESSGDHFRLCRTSEVELLARVHAADDIRVIAYGDDYADLPRFLDQLRPSTVLAGKAPGNVAYAKAAVLIATGRVWHRGGSAAWDLVVAPVLLPMPHDQFVSARSLDDEIRPEKLDSSSLHLEAKILIVAARNSAACRQPCFGWRSAVWL